MNTETWCAVEMLRRADARDLGWLDRNAGKAIVCGSLDRTGTTGIQWRTAVHDGLLPVRWDVDDKGVFYRIEIPFPTRACVIAKVLFVPCLKHAEVGPVALREKDKAVIPKGRVETVNDYLKHFGLSEQDWP